MKLLLLGHDYFKPWLIRAGVEVVHAGLDRGCDLVADPERTELSRLIAGLDPPPDALLLTDDLGRRLMPWGLERCLLPKIYYAVDSPINFYWQRHLAASFDLVLCDQKDAAENMSRQLDREALWLPVAVDPALYQGPEEDEACDFVFVGTLEPKVRPKRSNLIRLLQSRYRVLLAGQRGPGWIDPQKSSSLYRQARLSLNENLFPGVTTRMLEVMAAGGCLFTEDNDNGLRDLFRPGEHLVTFGPQDLFIQAERYLPDKTARKRMAQAAQSEVLAKHTIAARVESLLEAVANMERQGALRFEVQRKRLLGLAWTYLLLGLRWPHHDGGRRLMRARLLFKQALERGLDPDEARLGLGLALRAQGRLEDAAAAMLEVREQTFDAALIRGLILTDAGRRDEARASLERAARRAKVFEDFPETLAREGFRPGQADFHLTWGRILDRAGRGLTPGFNRRQLPVAFWDGLEHLYHALKLAPHRLDIAIALAELLDRHGQPAFARMFWQRAADLAPGDASLQDHLKESAALSYWPG